MNQMKFWKLDMKTFLRASLFPENQLAQIMEDLIKDTGDC